MKKIKALALALTILTAGILVANRSFSDDSQEAAAPSDDLVVVVDKKANKTYLTNYNDGHLQIINTFRTTLGQAIGDKLMEGDLRTPEGIYEFLFRSKAPDLKPIFGPLALYVSYPNSMDKAGQKTGFDILIHGTDAPERLEKKFDSKGCVVLDNENVKFISERIKLKDTKVIITQDFEALQNNPRLEKAKAFFQAWLLAWSNKDLDGYINSYANEFKSDGMNRIAFSKYKDALNKKYGTIKVTATNAHFFLHEKYDLVTFTQHYQSTMPNGQPAYQGVSKKNLYIQERNGQYKIILEETAK